MGIRIIGLTGGIASGKTTVSTHLRSLGATVLCADTIYHELIAPHEGAVSPLLTTIEQAFPGVTQPNGTLNRAALGQQVFGNPEKLNALGAITHPAVAHEVQARIDALEQSGLKLVFYDVPLLFERKLQSMFEGVVLVWVPPALQLERLIKRSKLSADEGQRRLESQMSIDEKRKLATWVLDNSKELSETYLQTEALYNILTP